MNLKTVRKVVIYLLQSTYLARLYEDIRNACAKPILKFGYQNGTKDGFRRVSLRVNSNAERIMCFQIFN